MPGYADMQICRYARICRYADMPGYADMQICRYADMQIQPSKQIKSFITSVQLILIKSHEKY